MECSSVQTLPLPVASTKQFQKYPISSIHNLGFYIDKLNEGNRIRRPFYLGVSGSALSFSARGRRRAISNGKSHNYSLRCSSQLASELAPAASAAYGVLLLGGGLFACKLFFIICLLIDFTFSFFHIGLSLLLFVYFLYKL